MTLLDALKIVNSGADGSRRTELRIPVMCGFTPLHYKTFLTAHLSCVWPGDAIRASEGLFGDLPGNLERLASQSFDLAVVAVEWSDLDPRLGLRSAGGWTPALLPEIVATARAQLHRVYHAVARVESAPVVISSPTLPLPPVFYSRPAQIGRYEAELRSEVASFVTRLAERPNVTVISAQVLDRVSPPDGRYDVKSEITTGFPYTTAHAEALAGVVAGAAFPAGRKKGLITDLDDTLWRHILGEVGVSGVCWSLEAKAQLHAIYQQFLASLAASGTLIAIASKNDADLVAEALGRQDLLLPKESVFPVEAHWGPKSGSVGRILQAWNIASDAVVFVDDSPMELAEVRAAFPDMECIPFPKDNPEQFWRLLFELREKFGTAQLTAEDSLRVDSLRSRAQFEEESQSAADTDSFLTRAQAEMTFSTNKPADRRAFELINKTNQFNLNGLRLTEAQWSAILDNPEAFVIQVGYTDRYGPLGTIGVLTGTVTGDCVSVEHWVMSCRAFSRRIEHRCLQYLFERFAANEVILRFVPTARNSPVREFLSDLLRDAPGGEVRLKKAQVNENTPALYHAVKEI